VIRSDPANIKPTDFWFEMRHQPMRTLYRNSSDVHFSTSKNATRRKRF
jgi:hypothetical protein